MASSAGNQNIGLAPTHGAHDRGDILGLFALTHDHFRKALAQRAVMIDLGKAKIFEGQVTQARNRLGDARLFSAHLLE